MPRWTNDVIPQNHPRSSSSEGESDDLSSKKKKGRLRFKS